MKYAITGITGQVGGATAQALLARGEEVRAVMRNSASASAWTGLGCEIALADLTDAVGLADAFRGVDGVFVMTPPLLEFDDPFAANTAMVASLRAALLEADAERVVYLSSIGAQHDHGMGAIAKLHEIEEMFAGLQIPSIGIRAGWFFENFRGQIAAVRENGVLASMLDPVDRAVPMIATSDIGTVAAELLGRRASGASVVELAVPTPYSSNDVARALAALLGRSVEAKVVSRGDRAAIYRSWGLSGRGADAMSSMIDGFNSGWIGFEGGAVERLEGATALEAALAAMLPTGVA